MPAQLGGGLDGVDEDDAAEVDVVVRKLVEDVAVVDALGAQVRVRVELRGTEVKGEVLVVVEAPHAVGAGGLEEVGCLDVPHEGDVAVEEAEDEGGVVGGVEEPKLAKTEAGGGGQQLAREDGRRGGGNLQPRNKVQLVPGAVVNSCPVAEALYKVPPHLLHRAHWQSKFAVPPCCPLGHSIVEAHKRFVSEPARGFLGRVVVDELLHFFKDGQELLNERGDFARVRVWQIEDRVPEVGYKRDNEMVGG